MVLLHSEFFCDTNKEQQCKLANKKKGENTIDNRGETELCTTCD